MASSRVSSLNAIIETLIPEARNNALLRNELVAHCEDILNSHIGRHVEADLPHLTELVKRRVNQSTPSGEGSLKFTNLLSRLLDQPVLSKKHESIQFLYTLSSPSRGEPSASLFLPSLAPPPNIPEKTHVPLDKPSTHHLGKSQAEILAEYRSNQDIVPLPEELLLRDALYLLQGISGKYIQLDGQANGTQNRLIFNIGTRSTVSAPTRSLIHRLAEVGYLYSRVERFVSKRENMAGVGMIEQSLCHYLQSQLTEYYRLIAVLESQMNISSKERSQPEDIPDIRAGETGLTLRRLDVWVNDWRLRMRMMSVCVEGATDVHGGALVNLIHSYTDNGDPFVRGFTDQLLEEVSKPFFTILHKWLFSGELHDPFNEFFVSTDPTLAQLPYSNIRQTAGGILPGDSGFSSGVGDDLGSERDDGLRLWQSKYIFRQEMLPLFVGEAFGRKIFSTGKSLNFIRYSCHDKDWVITRKSMSTMGDSLKYSDIEGLERSIDAAYRTASQRLFEVFLDKFKLLDHLKALKNYLMLGHGDFADQLMESLAPSLNRPANNLFRHNLTATLETAIRSSNAQHDPPDVLRRLDARMLEYSRGEIGWDVFTLEYKVDAPLDTVLDPESMVKYLKVFNHLWQMKRIEGALSSAWMRITGGTRTFLRVPELEFEWHRIRLAMSQMIHFIRQMQAYCHLEVIECSWKSLVDFLQKKEGDIDAMLDAHRTYLDKILKKVLLRGQKAGKEELLLNLVREVFTTVLLFRDATDNFYNYCLTESARRDVELDTQRGVFTGTTTRIRENSGELKQILKPLEEYEKLFSDRAQSIVHHLQAHTDLDCRFLGIRLSFSDFYRSKRDTASQKS